MFTTELLDALDLRKCCVAVEYDGPKTLQRPQIERSMAAASVFRIIKLKCMGIILDCMSGRASDHVATWILVPAEAVVRVERGVPDSNNRKRCPLAVPVFSHAIRNA